MTITINGLGDSITAQSVYQNVVAADGRFPHWRPATAYGLGQCIQNGGFAFTCQTPGVSTAGPGPSPDPCDAAAPVTDGTATWRFLFAQGCKNGALGGFLGWAEAFSLGRLHFDQTQGYGGYVETIRKIIVVSSGEAYTAPEVTLGDGAGASATVLDGRIVGVTVTNPGTTAQCQPTIDDSTGHGAVLSAVIDGSGTFGVSGCTTADMVARLPDCVASTIRIFTVHGGTNDLSWGIDPARIFANLRICYETLMDAGRGVVAIPILPRSLFVSDGLHDAMLDVNRAIRAYCDGDLSVNPRGYTGIALADCSALMADPDDPTRAANLGGVSGSAEAVLIDGLHPSIRGGMYMGLVVWRAARNFVPNFCLPADHARQDGYDILRHPSGNLLEGMPWIGNSPYRYGQFCRNAGQVYAVVEEGMSAGSGGPIGPGESCMDGTVRWRRLRPAGMSVFAGADGTAEMADGVAVSGTLASGYALARCAGSARGSVALTVESPRSPDRNGQRQILSFSLGSGTTVESWTLHALCGSYEAAGLTASDLDGPLFMATLDLQVTDFRNLSSVYLLGPFDQAAFTSSAGSAGAGCGARWAGHVGDVVSLPNDGRLLLATPPMRLPQNARDFNLAIVFNLDASGGEGSAFATVKLDHLAIRRLDPQPSPVR